MRFSTEFVVDSERRSAGGRPSLITVSVVRRNPMAVYRDSRGGTWRYRKRLVTRASR
jgi:hypothetical protein